MLGSLVRAPRWTCGGCHLALAPVSGATRGGPNLLVGVPVGSGVTEHSSWSRARPASVLSIGSAEDFDGSRWRASGCSVGRYRKVAQTIATR